MNEASSSIAVHIVIPVYNGAAFIEKTISSIRAQTHKNLSICVVDDWSDDSTPEIVLDICRNDSRVRYHRAPRKFGGPAGPRNYGTTLTDAIYVAFCDADDIWHPMKLEIQIGIMHERSLGFSCTAVRKFSDESEFDLASSLSGLHESTLLNTVGMLGRNSVATSSVVLLSEIARELNGFDESSELVAVEDYDFWLRILDDGKTVGMKIETELVGYRLVSTSLSSKKAKQVKRVFLVHKLHFERGRLKMGSAFFSVFSLSLFAFFWLLNKSGR